MTILYVMFNHKTSSYNTKITDGSPETDNFCKKFVSYFIQTYFMREHTLSVLNHFTIHENKCHSAVLAIISYDLQYFTP